MKSYFLIEIHYDPKNNHASTLINEMIDTSLFIGVEIVFQLFKKEQISIEQILLKLSFFSDRFMNEKQMNFYSFYLDTYFQENYIKMENLISTDIN